MHHQRRGGDALHELSGGKAIASSAMVSVMVDTARNIMP